MRKLLTRSIRFTCVLWEERTEIENETMKMYLSDLSKSAMFVTYTICLCGCFTCSQCFKHKRLLYFFVPIRAENWPTFVGNSECVQKFFKIPNTWTKSLDLYFSDFIEVYNKYVCIPKSFNFCVCLFKFQKCTVQIVDL